MKRKYSSSSAAAIMQKFKRARPTRIPRPIQDDRLKEIKYSELYVTNSTLTSVMAIYNLNGIGQGDTYSTRNGNQVINRSIQYNFQCKTVAGTLPITCTVYIVLDRQCNGVTPTASALLDTSLIPVNYAMKNVGSASERFTILRHHYFPSFATGNASESAVVKGYIDLSKLPMRDQISRYAGSTATDPLTNGLYLFVVSDNGTSGNINFFGGFRVSFTE